MLKDKHSLNCSCVAETDICTEIVLLRELSDMIVTLWRCTCMQIAPGVYSMTQEEGGRVHGFLLDDGNGLTIVDTLFNDDASIVLDEIRKAGKEPSDLKNIILTHAHRSHIGGAALLKELSKATVYSHQWEQGIIEGKRKAAKVGLWPKKPFEAYKLQIGLALGLKPHKPCVVDKELKDGDRIGPLQVLSTPGHTPGCLSFYWPEKKALFTGDVVVSWPAITAGWPGLTLDNAENFRSIGKLSDASDAEMLCVGHGSPILKDGARILRNLRDKKPVA